MAWEYSDNEYIKLFRKLINWEWYSDTPTRSVFIHCLLKANWKPTNWKGITLERGEFIETNQNMAKTLGLSLKQIRVALGHLEGTNSVTFRKVGKYRIINVSKYVGYQSEGTTRAPKRALKGHLEGTERALDIRSKEYIRSKEDNILPSAEEKDSGYVNPFPDDEEGEDPMEILRREKEQESNEKHL